MSCCQRSDFVASGAWRNAFLSPGRAETGAWPDAFDYCRGKCRTNPKSTVRAQYAPLRPQRTQNV